MQAHGSPARVLVVEDEASLLAVTIRSLEFAGYAATGASTVAEARAAVRDAAFDLALLDVMLPDGSGLELAAELHDAHGDMPLIFVTARDSIDDRLTGFALGGDDYVVKPFSVAELIARVGAVLRRTADQREHPALQVGDLVLSVATHEVRRGTREIDLSPTEFRLLHLLMQHQNQVLTKDQILAQVWGYDVGDTGIVEKFISQLRRKVGDDPESLIHTVRGFGYVVRLPKGRG